MMPAAKKKSINFWSIITSIVVLTGGCIFAIYDRVNASIDKRIETIAERKILACPQIQKVDTIYRMLEINYDQHKVIIEEIKEMSRMIEEMNRGNKRFAAYYSIRQEDELIGPHQGRQR
jgi:hypothetical protein